MQFTCARGRESYNRAQWGGAQREAQVPGIGCNVTNVVYFPQHTTAGLSITIGFAFVRIKGSKSRIERKGGVNVSAHFPRSCPADLP